MNKLIVCIGWFLFSMPGLRAQAPEPRTDSMAGVVFQYIKTGNWQAVHHLFDSTLQKRVPLPVFTNQFNQLQRTALGNIQKISFDRRQNRTHFYKADFDEASLLLLLTLNDTGSLSGFALRKYFVPGQDSVIGTSNSLRTPLDRKVDSIVRSHIKISYAAGMSIGIITGDSTLFYGYGETEKGNAFVPTPNTLFEIGSITKTFTSLLLALEINKGRIHPDSCISAYLPDSLPRMEWKGIPVTIRMLSNHTSGIPSLPLNFKTVPGFDAANPYKGYTKEMLFRYFKSFTPYREPGRSHEYSNMAVALLGNILEQVNRSNWPVLVHQQILEPLKLQHTGTLPSRIKGIRYTTGYKGTGETTSHWTMQAFAPAGALHSTAADMIQYARFVLSPGKGPLPEALEYTLRPGFTVSATSKIGLGWYLVTVKGKQYITHSGGTGGYRSTLVIDRNSKKAVVVLSNTANEVDPVAFQLLEYVSSF